jgi:hypothetical protein
VDTVDPKDATCFSYGQKGHIAPKCPSPRKGWKERKKEKEKSGSEGANKTAEEKAEAVAEFAGKASAVSEHEANSTPSNIFHWNIDTGTTSHMTPHKSWICNYCNFPISLDITGHRLAVCTKYFECHRSQWSCLNRFQMSQGSIASILVNY